MTLGMSKLKVSTILVLETVIVGVISLGIGLLLGIGLSQLLSIFTAKLFARLAVKRKGNIFDLCRIEA